MRPCKYAVEGFDWVPRPFGEGMVEMPNTDCIYGGDIDLSEVEDLCGEHCPAYVPEGE